MADNSGFYASNPWKTLNEQLWQADVGAAVVVASACVRVASAVFEVAGVEMPRGAPFGGGSLAGVGLGGSVAGLVAPIVAAHSAAAPFAADPETGELPDDDGSDRAELLGMAAEMVVRAVPGMDESGLRQWADTCSTLAGDLCQYLDMLACADVRTAPDDVPPGPLSAEALRLQLQILSLLVSAPDRVAMPRISELVESAREPIVEAVRNVLGG